MVRTQIQLTEEQTRKLKELSLSSNESIASLIRHAIDRYLLTGQPPSRGAKYQQALALVGKYQTEESDAAVEHDRYLEKSFGS